MKPVFGFSRKVFNCKISRVFFAANLVVCAAAFDWNAGFDYYRKLNTIGCKPKPISFGLYDISGLIDISNEIQFLDRLSLIILFLLVAVILVAFVAPSYAICGMILTFLKSSHPGWCDETFDLIGIPIFMIVNCVYWTLLGYLIESSYLKSIQNKPARKNPLSIYSG